MPKQTYKIQQFHGGLNSDSDPRDLIEGQSPSLVDCGIDSVGRLKLMGATTEVDGSGSSFTHTPLTTKNRGLFVMSSDRQLDGGSGDETLIFSYDSGDNKVDARDSETTTTGGWDANVISPGGAIDPVYYAADGVVRVADKAFNQSTRWFGYITDERFNGINGDSGAIGWYDTNQAIPAPTVGKCLISTPVQDTDTNGVNSAANQYIGEVIDGSAAQSSTSVANPQVAEGNAVNLRVGVQYNTLLPDTASDILVTGGSEADSKNSPYPFGDNNLRITGSTGTAALSNATDTFTDGILPSDSQSWAISFFITSGRQYDDLDKIRIKLGSSTDNYQWHINRDEITTDCWNFIICAKGTHDVTEGTPADWGEAFSYWNVIVDRRATGFIVDDGPTWQMSSPMFIPVAPDGFPTGTYTFHYTWLYDAENKQESLPYKFGDIDTTYSGEHDAGDHGTVMTDSGESFIADQLIGRLIKNTTDVSEGVITDNTSTTVTVGALLYGSDNSWDTSGDDDYEIPPVNVNKLVIVRSPCLLNFDVYTIPKPAGSYGINKRISGARLYWKSEDNDNYFLIGELDFIDNGFKWVQQADTVAYSMENTDNTSGDLLGNTALVRGISPDSVNTVDTFKNINGFSSETKSLDAQFKTAVIQGRRTYIGNIKQDGKTHPDRILKSQVNRFDTFPQGMGIVDVAIRDGENIVKLEAFADRILEFKENSLYIINISDNIEFLEDTYRNKGCAYDYHVVKTDQGIAWFNIHGVYLYDGKQLHNLLEKGGIRVINESDWQIFVTDHRSGQANADDPDMGSAQIGYIPKKRQILIKNENNDVYLYDFVLRAWTSGLSRVSETSQMTNFALSADQDLFYIDDVDTDINTWQTSPQASTGFLYETPDIDFGEPGVRKKIHKVYVTYKTAASGDVVSNVFVDYDVNGGTTFPYDFADGTNFASAELAYANGWQVAVLKPDVSSEANNIKSFQLRFQVQSGETVPAGFEINDITIVYRMKHIK